MYNRDGTKVLTGSQDGAARVYDATDGREVVVLHTGTAEVRRATFDLAGERRDQPGTLSEPAGWIITVTGDGWIHVFDETTYILIARRRFGTVYTAFRIPGTRSIVLTQGFDPPMIWRLDAADAASVNLEPLIPEYRLCNWAIPSPDGSRVAACYSNQVVRVIDVSNRRVYTTIRGHLAQMGGMAFSPDGSRLVTASLDSTVRVWDTSSGEQLRVLFGHEGYIWSADFNADGTEILTAGAGAVLAWNTRAEDDRESFSTHGIQGYDSVAYSPDGRLLVTSSVQNGVRLHDARTHRLLREIDAAPSTHIAFSSDGKRLASVRAILAGPKGPADTVHLWDASTWESVAVITAPSSGVSAVALNTDGSRLAVSTWNHGGHLYDGNGNLIAALPGFDHWAGGMTFTPDGAVLLAGMRGDHLFQWRAADGTRLADSPIAVSGLNSLVFGPGGSVLGTTEAGYASLWDAASGKTIHELRGHGGPLRGAAFLAAGSRIATAARDGTVRLWDSASGDEVAVFRTTRSFPEVLAVNPNGEELAVSFDDIDIQFFGIVQDRNQTTASGSASSRQP
jgi:WD40 repeat protein